jgi:hypothetical protein
LHSNICIGGPKIGIVRHTKYTVGKISSQLNKSGYDYIFVWNNDRREGHQRGDFIPGHKYLVAYDSTNIKNGFLILDKFDVTDSLEKHRIFGEYGLYWEGWSLQKYHFSTIKAISNLKSRKSLIHTDRIDFTGSISHIK